METPGITSTVKTFGREYHVIFGIDGLSRMDKPEIYQFTKTARVLELPNQYLPEEMKGRSILTLRKMEMKSRKSNSLDIH